MRQRLPDEAPVRFVKRELSACVLALEQLLLHNTALYTTWLTISPWQRHRLHTDMSRCIQRHLLSEAFWLAVKADIMQQTAHGIQVDTTSHLYSYLKKVVFRGDSRAMLLFLASKE